MGKPCRISYLIERTLFYLLRHRAARTAQDLWGKSQKYEQVVESRLFKHEPRTRKGESHAIFSQLTLVTKH
jgi:hypothetical protein